MASPDPTRQPDRARGEAWRALRTELGALADVLVDAGAMDRPLIQARVRHAADIHRRCADGQDDLGRLLQYIMADLSGDAAALDTLYYARMLVVVADRLPN